MRVRAGVSHMRERLTFNLAIVGRPFVRRSFSGGVNFNTRVISSFDICHQREVCFY